LVGQTFAVTNPALPVSGGFLLARFSTSWNNVQTPQAISLS
jgi:hypothetical protein